MKRKLKGFLTALVTRKLPPMPAYHQDVAAATWAKLDGFCPMVYDAIRHLTRYQQTIDEDSIAKVLGLENNSAFRIHLLVAFKQLHAARLVATREVA